MRQQRLITKGHMSNLLGESREYTMVNLNIRPKSGASAKSSRVLNYYSKQSLQPHNELQRDDSFSNVMTKSIDSTINNQNETMYARFQANAM